ncbi:baseplate J/gp47 family protein [Xanthobacter sp. V3C-3]|uniref:baseplate J/gp47 family protein n=1 Tax=Xanthobacter lutulentifluminis TaxID=3119935 RepID=UPI00372795FD
MAYTCTVDRYGISSPTLEEIRAQLVTQFQAIYGTDVYLEPDSQDGQWIGILATAIHDCNAMAVSVYNAFSPATAQGEGLSRMVKINGIARHIASKSTADLLLGGTVGTVITNGYATDSEGNKWMLPEEVVIGMAGQITVTATASTPGAVSAAPGAISIIGTPTRGWQTVTNILAAVEGDPVETDVALRRRQAVSTEIPSQTLFEGLVGAVAAIPGVTRFGGVDNDGDATDENGIPGHSFSLVIEGGDAQTIAQTVYVKKGPGAGTFGTTSEVVVDSYGVPHTIRFMRPTNVSVKVAITLKALTGYTTNIGAKIKSAVVDYINALNVGDEVYLTRLFSPANLSGSDGATFDITNLQIAKGLGSLGSANLLFAYHEAPACSVDDIAITVT